MRRSILILTGASLLLAGCANAVSEDADPGSTTGEEAEPLDEGLFASCGAVRFPELPPDPAIFERLRPGEQAEIDLTRLGDEAPFAEQFFEGYDWRVAGRGRDRLTLFGEPVFENEMQPRYASAEFERQGDRWIPMGLGECRIEITAPGWGNARFVLDPDSEPDPASSAVSVLATEFACASGRRPEGRDVRAVVLEETDESVSIVILVEPPEGGQTCPGNPSFSYRVQLGSPLGNRTVFDASVHPPLPRPRAPR